MLGQAKQDKEDEACPLGGLHFSDIFTSLCVEFGMLECASFATCIHLSARRCFCTMWLTLLEKALLTAIHCLLVQIVIPKNTSSFLLGLFEKNNKKNYMS